MKKLLLFVAIAMCAFSCTEYNVNLNKTLWKYQYDYDSTPYYIEFVGKNKVIAFVDDYQYDEGTYKQSGAKITFYDLELREGLMGTMIYKSAVQTNNTLTLTYADKDGDEDKRLYIKQ